MDSAAGDGEDGDRSAQPRLTDPTLIAILAGSSAGIFGVQAAPPALPRISTDLVVSDAEIGLVLTAFYLAAAVISPIVGIVVDMYGRRRPFIGSLLLFGLSGMSVIFVNTFEMLLVLRAIQGIAFAGVTPITIALIGDLYDGPAGSTAQGLRTGGHGIVTIIGPAVAGFLAGFSWRYPFLIFGFAFPTALFVYYTLPKIGPEPSSDGTESASTSNGGRTIPSLGAYIGSVRTELRSARLAVLILGVAIIYFVKTGLVTFLPLFAVRNLEVSPFAAGVMLSVRGVVRILVSPMTGVIEANLNRTLTLYTSFGLLAGTALLFSATESFFVVVLLFAIYSIGDALGVPLLNNSITGLTNMEQRAGVVSLMNTLKVTANAASPIFFGLILSTFDFELLFTAVSGVAIAYSAVLYVVVQRSEESLNG